MRREAERGEADVAAIEVLQKAFIGIFVEQGVSPHYLPDWWEQRVDLIAHDPFTAGDSRGMVDYYIVERSLVVSFYTAYQDGSLRVESLWTNSDVSGRREPGVIYSTRREMRTVAGSPSHFLYPPASQAWGVEVLGSTEPVDNAYDKAEEFRDRLKANPPVRL